MPASIEAVTIAADARDIARDRMWFVMVLSLGFAASMA
jgi:hypothetical protein